MNDVLFKINGSKLVKSINYLSILCSIILFLIALYYIYRGDFNFSKFTQIVVIFNLMIMNTLNLSSNHYIKENGIYSCSIINRYIRKYEWDYINKTGVHDLKTLKIFTNKNGINKDFKIHIDKSNIKEINNFINNRINKNDNYLY